jgi:hypothetical protein
MRRVAFTSSASEVVGFWTTLTPNPSLRSAPVDRFPPGAVHEPTVDENDVFDRHEEPSAG